MWRVHEAYAAPFSLQTIWVNLSGRLQYYACRWLRFEMNFSPQGGKAALRGQHVYSMSVFSAQRPAHASNAAGEAPHRRRRPTEIGKVGKRNRPDLAVPNR
ncbi:hypothetical protein F5888DRAFT_1894973 [Russula emetica]|nr:hypothetical protein F5888DRAFT_1894973 [Russula emetica]